MKLFLLDLFCGAGGAALGYYRAGFRILGVDHEPQPHYPFQFVQADALEYLQKAGRGFDVIHASPPCQLFSKPTHIHGDRNNHLDLITPTRELLLHLNKPYIIENVPGAPLLNPALLCGTMFSLNVRRHRLFETTFPLPQRRCWHHSRKTVGVYGHSGGSSTRNDQVYPSLKEWRNAMKIQWMTAEELKEAIPPSYTRWIGEQFLAQYE